MDELDKYQEASWSSSVDVFIQVSYTKIFDVDTINQRFQAELIIESKWYDPNVKSMNDSFNQDEMWTPEIYVDNAIKDLHEESLYKVIPDKQSDGFLVCEMRKVRGIFWENLELENFPLDVQDLSIMVASKKPGSIVNFVLMQPTLNNLQISHTLDRSMWQMHNIVITKRDRIRREYSYGKREYPAVKVTAQVFRLPGFFYWNAVLPILLVTMASLCPFVIDVKLPQSRLPSTATMLLTSVSMRWIVGRLLPTVSYLTSLDKYSLGSTVIIVMLLLYHATIAALYPSLPENFGYRIDKAAFVCFFMLILLKQLLFLIWIAKVTSYRKNVRANKKLHIIPDNDSFYENFDGYNYHPYKSTYRLNMKTYIMNLFKKKEIYSSSEIAEV